MKFALIQMKTEISVVFKTYITFMALNIGLINIFLIIIGYRIILKSQYGLPDL